MDFEKLCAERYSLRKYADCPVEAEKLEKVLEAGHNAPTAHNLQLQRILVMQSREALEKAEECTACKFHAPVILVVAYDPAKAWNREGDMKNHGEIDATIAATQMMLQAADLGLGTCYVGMFSQEKLHAVPGDEGTCCDCDASARISGRDGASVKTSHRQNAVR